MNKETAFLIKELAYYSSLGLQVAVSIFIGLFTGVALDRYFGTTPVLILVFLALGIAAGFRNILLALKKAKSFSIREFMTLPIQQRILAFVTRTNWLIFIAASLLGYINLPLDFAKGIMAGGVIVTVNFHLLSRTLTRSLSPQNLSSSNIVLAKYYLRFFISALIIFFLISKQFVNPLGLVMGLSVVVLSISLAAMCELTKQIFKEAV